MTQSWTTEYYMLLILYYTITEVIQCYSVLVQTYLHKFLQQHFCKIISGGFLLSKIITFSQQAQVRAIDQDYGFEQFFPRGGAICWGELRYMKSETVDEKLIKIHCECLSQVCRINMDIYGFSARQTFDDFFTDKIFLRLGRLC